MAAFEKRVCGIQKMSLLDFADKTSCILWYLGCNNTCPYCYNPTLVRGEATTRPAQEVVSFLKKRKGVLDGVVFSGGECTVWGERLIEDVKFVRDMGYAVKIDTNGTKTEIVRQLIDEKLVDFVAIDIKCPQSKWNMFYRSEQDYAAFRNTLEMLLKSGVTFETRTTIHPDIVSEEDLSEMLCDLKNIGHSGVHNIQYFFTGDNMEYLKKDLNRTPRRFLLDRVERHGFEINVRNPNGNP